MSILSKEKTKQTTGHWTGNKQIRKSLKRSINRSYYQVTKIKKKEFDTGNKGSIQRDNIHQDRKRNRKNKRSMTRLLRYSLETT